MFKKDLNENKMFKVKDNSFRYFKPDLRLRLNLEVNMI